MSQRRRREADGLPKVLLLSAILALLTAAVLITAAVRLFTRYPDPAEVEANLPDYVTKDLLTVNDWSRPGDPLKRVNGIVLHYVGNPGTTAQANRNYFESLSSGSPGRDQSLTVRRSLVT